MVERQRGGVGGMVGGALAEQHRQAMRDVTVDVVLDEPQARTHLEQVEQRDRLLVGCRATRARRAGASRSSRPSPTSIPTAACVIDLAVLHDTNVVSGVTSSGPNTVAGCTP